METTKNTENIHGYCSMCTNWCPTIAHVRDGVFISVSSDKEHPLASPICPKGFAGPELVYSPHRLKYPMKRTTPKENPDPAWQRISWDEALDTIAEKLNKIKQDFGPEAVAFTRAGPGGSPMGELAHWVVRLGHVFGSPNNIGTTNICQWHRDNASAYTYGRPGMVRTGGKAEFERSGCILIWGNNIHATRSALLPLIEKGIKQGAKLIVIDPRKIEIADMADLWLQVKPGTDGILAMSMINVLLEDKTYDHDFVRDWTTAPFLVNTADGRFLMADELTASGDPAHYVVIDAQTKKPLTYMPGTQLATEPALYGTFTVKNTNGIEVTCKTVFQLLRESVSDYRPEDAEAITSVPAAKIREAATMFATVKPSSWYSWNGTEQTTNATQTNRAICILYALTGSYDIPGGNVVPPPIYMNPINGLELLTPEADAKRLGQAKRPLGPAGRFTACTAQGYEVFEAMLTGKPYPVRGLVAFGNNLPLSNSPCLSGKKALCGLDVHVHVDMFMSPAAEMADIVLPAASAWECWHVGTNMDSLSENGFIQVRPAVVPPQHESRPDMDILFEMAERLGLGDKFWNGDRDAAVDYQFAPSKITMEQLRKNDGLISLKLPMEYQKYAKKDGDGNFVGFATPSKRIELYSSLFLENGYEPLPTWEEPPIFGKQGVAEKYPLILTSTKVSEYCHSQQRAIPMLRKRVPHPFLEINTQKAAELGIKNGDWLSVETPYGGNTLQAKLTESIADNVVSTQNGWWQSCPELNLPGYDPFSPEGANSNLLCSTEDVDHISGCFLIKGIPCNVRQAKK